MTEQFTKVQLQGIIASDPEIRYQTSGMPVTSMSVSVQREIGQRHTVDYLDVVVIGDGAEDAATTFRKGQPVRIDGQLVTYRRDVRGAQKQSMVVKATTIMCCEPGSR